MWSTSNLKFSTQTHRGKEMIVKESMSGKAKLVSYPVTLVINDNPRAQWMVQLGIGNVEDDDFDWKEVKPPNISCEPYHGIAAPLSHDSFEGKLFCYLPLPGVTQLPVHIHGHFMLHSNRRGLWVSSITSKKALYTQFCDPKEHWNKLLVKAIGTSYAHFLVNFTSNIKPPILRSHLLLSYYNYFPTTDNLTSTDAMSPLAKHVYQTLYKLNAPILIRLTEYPSDKSDTSIKEDNEKSYKTDWYNLLMPNTQNECFFYDADPPIVNVLTSIGMNLIDTPMHIRRRFNEADDEIELSVISEYTVLKYYDEFCSHVLNENKLPCPISCTRFDNTENLSVLLEYLLNTHNKFPVRYERIASLGLLVTADGNLHCLSDGKKIISSSNWHLFPKSKQCFVHDDLRKYYPTHSHYLFPSNKFNEHFTCIKSIIQDNYPSSHSEGNTKMSWIQVILRCLANDDDFFVHWRKILENIPLIPSKNTQFYSTKSKVLPLKCTSALSEKFSYRPRYDASKVEQLLEKLNVPLLRNDIIAKTILDKIENHLPSLLIPDDILKILFLLKESNLHLYSELSEEDLHLLFAVLKLASYSDRKNQTYIKHLPIFTTMNGKLVSLAGKPKVLVWSSTEVCDAGIQQWMKYTSNDVIFLSLAAPWKCIYNEANNLQIYPIDKYSVYCDNIFPHFHHLDPDVQMSHLTFIRANIYPKCKYTLSFEDAMRNSENDYERACLFARTLQRLQCIHDDAGTLRCIGTFYDCNDTIFNAFCNKSDFLPSHLRKEKWQNFLEYFGLKTVPSVDEFVIYCRTLQKLGSIPKIKHASSVLLTALLCTPTDSNNKYIDLQSEVCFKKVIDIPIAVVEEIPELNSIIAQKMGELLINDNESTIYLTSLPNCSTVDNRYLLWTIAPLINLPTGANYQRIKDCDIVQSPSVESVITNLNALSCTTFTNFSRFEKQDTSSLIDKSSLLPKVVVSMLKYIQTQLNEEQIHIDDCKRLALAQTKFLPVKLSITSGNAYVLVKPTQVLHAKSANLLDAISSQDQSSRVAQFYPFLHPLIEEAYGVVDFLSSVGVQNSINFSHVQLVLQLAKNKYQDNVVDINTKRVIIKAIDELITLLHNVQNQGKDNESDVAQYLKPLYLLNQEDRLVECSKLIVFDVVGLPQFLPPMGYYYLNPLKDDKQIRSNSLSNLLPKELGLKSLKFMLEYDVIDGTQTQEVFPSVAIMKDILLSEEFKLGIELLAKCNSIDGAVPTLVTSTLESFQCNVTVQYMNHFNIKPNLKIGNEIIQIDNVFKDWYFLLKRSTDIKWTLCFKNTNNTYPHVVFLNLAKQLCSRLKLKSMDCFSNDNDSSLDLVAFVSLMLQSQSVSKVVDVICKNIPNHYMDDLQLSPKFTSNEDPTLGEAIAECWHHRLDQNVLNLFQPEEWVGYETQEGLIIYAQIMHEIEPVTKVNNVQEKMQRKLLVEIGNDTQVEVHILELYKFIQNDTNILDTKATGTNIDVRTKEIKAAVQAALALPTEQQFRAFKRLYLTYHPEKNADNPNATAEFQYLMEEIEQATKDISIDSTDGKQPPSSQPNINSCFNQWNQTASSHKKYKSSTVKSKPPTVPTSHKDLNIADVWIRQAAYDYTALCALKTVSGVSGTICFMCHQVAEKSLKAGMYAKCGLGQESLKKHNLGTLAYALMQVGCPIKPADAHLLERFYLDTRFPNRYSPCAVPGDLFDSYTAQQAFEAATRLFEILQQAVNDS